MTEDEVWSLVVRVPPPLQSAVAAWLFDQGVEGLEEREGPSGTELVAYGAEARVAALGDAVALWGAERVEDDPMAGRVEVRVEAVGSAWRERWSEALGPVVLSDELTVVPDDGETAPDRRHVVLERQLAFGFGEHPTTRMAARALDALVRARSAASVLDVGAGGGLLSIVAARAGASRVLGIDVDPLAVAVATRNAARNAARCAFRALPIEQVEGAFDVVVANIDARTLVRLAPDLARVTANGVLMLTGFLAEDQDALAGVYAALGLAVTARVEEDDWLLLSVSRDPGAPTFLGGGAATASLG